MSGHFDYSGTFVIVRLGPKNGKLYAMKKYVERFGSSDEETAAAAPLQLSNIDAAQEESVLEKESANKSAPPKIYQGETSSKKSLLKN